jgi:hypothetical protein
MAADTSAIDDRLRSLFDKEAIREVIQRQEGADGA